MADKISKDGHVVEHGDGTYTIKADIDRINNMRQIAYEIIRRTGRGMRIPKHELNGMGEQLLIIAKELDENTHGEYNERFLEHPVSFKCGHCDEVCETRFPFDEFVCPNCREGMIPNDELAFCSHCGDELDIEGGNYICCEECGLRYHSGSDYCAGWTDVGFVADSSNWEKGGVNLNEIDGGFKGKIVCDKCMKDKGFEFVG